jgi:hypothetical protein
VPRRVNWELRSIIVRLYSSGYRRPRELAEKVAELTGRRYRESYIKKVLWDLRRRGLLSGKGPRVWDDFETWEKGVSVHLVAAKDLLLKNDARGALSELDRAIECLRNMEKAYQLIRVAYAGR